jgi:probable F420-dependent oxidoreductase
LCVAVINAGVRDPLTIAGDAATLDDLSGGRCILGLGAGHTRAEWSMLGRQYPSPSQRVARLAEVAEAVTALLRGEVVSRSGQYIQLEDAFLLHPGPVQPRVPLLVGGNGRETLRIACRFADIINLTGLLRTLEDGYHHEADWSVTAVDERIALIREARRAHLPVLEALVQHVEVTNDRRDAAARLAGRHPGLTDQDVLDSPYALIGTVEQIAEELLQHQARWEISSYLVPAEALDTMTEVMAHLH